MRNRTKAPAASRKLNGAPLPRRRPGSGNGSPAPGPAAATMPKRKKQAPLRPPPQVPEREAAGDEGDGRPAGEEWERRRRRGGSADGAGAARGRRGGPPPRPPPQADRDLPEAGRGLGRVQGAVTGCPLRPDARGGQSPCTRGVGPLGASACARGSGGPLGPVSPPCESWRRSQSKEQIGGVKTPATPAG